MNKLKTAFDVNFVILELQSCQRLFDSDKVTAKYDLDQAIKKLFNIRNSIYDFTNTSN